MALTLVTAPAVEPLTLQAAKAQLADGDAWDNLRDALAPMLRPPEVIRNCLTAGDAAYRAVRKPVEGTMLTVIRELAEEAEAQARPDLPVADLLRALVRRGEDALANTETFGPIVGVAAAATFDDARSAADWASLAFCDAVSSAVVNSSTG